MKTQIASILADPDVMGRHPELLAVFMYFNSRLASMVEEAQNLGALCEAVRVTVAKGIGYPLFDVKAVDSNRDDLEPTETKVPNVICLLLVENSKYVLH